MTVADASASVPAELAGHTATQQQQEQQQSLLPAPSRAPALAPASASAPRPRSRTQTQTQTEAQATTTTATTTTATSRSRGRRTETKSRSAYAESVLSERSAITSISQLTSMSHLSKYNLLEVSSSSRIRKWIVILAAVVYEITLGSILSFGNIQIYIASYMTSTASQTQQSAYATMAELYRYNLSQTNWIFATSYIIFTLSCVLGTHVESQIGARLTLVLSSVLVWCGIGFTYLTIANLYATVFCYGILFGAGAGIAFPVPIICALRWQCSAVPYAMNMEYARSARPRFDTFEFTNNYRLLCILFVSFFSGSMIFCFLQTSILNPTNIPMRAGIGYSDSVAILPHIPYLFVWFAATICAAQCVCIVCLSNPRSHRTRMRLLNEERILHPQASEVIAINAGNKSSRGRSHFGSDQRDHDHAHGHGHQHPHNSAAAAGMNMNNNNNSNAINVGDDGNDAPNAGQKAPTTALIREHMKAPTGYPQQSMYDIFVEDGILEFELQPMEIVLCREFWILWMIHLLSMIVYLFMILYWKVLAAEYYQVPNDYSLTVVGTFAFLLNGLSRLAWKELYFSMSSKGDKYAFRKIIIPVNVFCAVLIGTLALPQSFLTALYFVWILLIFSFIGGHSLFYPCIIAQTFGARRVNTVMSFFLMADIPAVVLVVVLMTNMLSDETWNGFSLIISAFCVLNIILSLVFDNSRAISQRQKRNRLKNVTFVDYKSTLVAQNCGVMECGCPPGQCKCKNCKHHCSHC